MNISKQVLFGIVGIILFGSTMNFIIKKIVLKDYKVNLNKEILVFGDSHAEFNFYDKENKIQNFGVSAEAPNLTYLKAQHLLNDNNTHKVIIALSPHNISSWREKRLYEQDSSAAILSQYWNLLDNRHLLKYYSTLPLKTRILLHLKKITGAPSTASSFFVKNTFKGEFYKGKDTSFVSLNEAKKTYTKHFGEGNANKTSAILNSDKFMNCYKELISFFVSKGSQVFIIGTPLHKNYLNLVSSTDYEYYDNFLIGLKLDFPQINIRDYRELDFPDHYYINSDHLNLRGAKYFTEVVIKEIYKQ